MTNEGGSVFINSGYMEKDVVVRIEGVSKYFSKVIANKDVTFDIHKGEVVALLGENGAGKSTIMKVLYGLYSRDEGEIFIDGKPVNIASPRDAIAHGISMIQQHFSLVESHTVTENIILGTVKGRINIGFYNDKIKSLCDLYGFDIPVDAKICDLSVGQQQKVEILKALYLNARVLIMDEPTAVLTPQEADSLMVFIKDFVSKGNSVFFITHKMREVMSTADRIVVMKTGRVSGIVNASSTNERELASLMMNSESDSIKPTFDKTSGTEVLTVSGLSYKDKTGVERLNDVSFDIKEGEVFGVVGVSGNGQDELSEIIAGVIKPNSGCIKLGDKDITSCSVRERIKCGIGYSPLDRLKDGMIGNMTLSENLMIKESFKGDRWVKNGFLRLNALKKYTDEKIKEYQIKASGESDLARSLSGGNQQKVVLAREVDIAKKLLVLNQPTRGLDVGAVDRIHRIILSEKDKGRGVLLISTEISEIFDICSRFTIMYRGRLMGIYNNGELNTSEVGLLMAGVQI